MVEIKNKTIFFSEDSKSIKGLHNLALQILERGLPSKFDVPSSDLKLAYNFVC